MTRDDFILKAMISMASDSQWGLKLEDNQWGLKSEDSQWGLKSDFDFEIKVTADEMANAARLLARAAEDVCHVKFDK